MREMNLVTEALRKLVNSLYFNIIKLLNSNMLSFNENLFYKNIQFFILSKNFWTISKTCLLNCVPLTLCAQYVIADTENIIIYIYISK